MEARHVERLTRSAGVAGTRRVSLVRLLAGTRRAGQARTGKPSQKPRGEVTVLAPVRRLSPAHLLGVSGRNEWTSELGRRVTRTGR
jgi:hypothetical protein